MKKRYLFTFLLALLLPAILLICGALLPAYYGESYYAQLPSLYQKLEKTQGKKIVIVGGSNIAFGVNSMQMEEILTDQGYDYTVCNFGLYGAVGTSAMLELSKDHIQEGDIVILAIEPTSQTFSSYFGATAMLKCAESNPEILLHLSGDQLGNVVGNYISYLQERAQIYRTGLLPQPDGVYAKASFDENGDMIFDRAGNNMLLGYDSAISIDLEGIVFEEAFVEQVNDYIDYANKKGAEVVMSFSPMNLGGVVDRSQDAVYAFFFALQEQFDCTIISDPNLYLMESGWFYDSNFHLNSAGAQTRTYYLACDLLNHLGCYEKIFYEMPQIPESIAQTDNSTQNSEDFLFEPLGENGLIISGLTEQGAQKEKLIVPAFQDGKAVVGMTADAFLGNTVIRELVLPGSVSSIPDGAFWGCTNLRKMTLLHTDTTAVVGEGLLEGTQQVTIYVPSGAYHLYRDGAGCAANPWEFYLDCIVPY